MERYKKEVQGTDVTLWDTDTGIGLRFKAGETLQRYSSILLLPKSKGYTDTEEGLATVTAVDQALTEIAAKEYPKEFTEIKN